MKHIGLGIVHDGNDGNGGKMKMGGNFVSKTILVPNPPRFHTADESV